MKPFLRPFFYGWLMLPALVALAQEPPAPATSPEPPPTAPTTPAIAEAAPATAAANSEPSTLRRLDIEPPAEPANAPGKKAPAKRPVRRSHNGNDRVAVLNGTRVDEGEVVTGDAISVMGDLVIDGEVQGDAIAVMGDNTINGLVHGEVVAVMGDVTLGPKAHVDGKITAVGGSVRRDPAAFVGGSVTQKSARPNIHVGLPIQSWWTHGLKLGRPLAFGAGLAWLWVATAASLAFYALLALLFPGSLRRTGDLLVQRPVAVVLSAMLTMIALPVVFVLLLVTVVGIPVALLVLPTGIFLSVIFGKASIYGLVGRRLSGDSLHPSVAVLAGATIFILLYLVPIVGLVLTLLLSALGFGCSITALFTSRKKSLPPAAPLTPAAAVVAQGAFAPVANPSFTPQTPTSRSESSMSFIAAAAMPSPEPFGRPSESAAPAMTSPPPYVSPGIVSPTTSLTVPNASLPRAGFWIRTAALLIDFVLVAVIFGPMGAGPLIFPFLAAYAACMWQMKGTTVGGIVCGLRVVRLDDRPLDWPTVIVRSLGCFLSLVVAGLGFVWVVFDDERQSWHDKIAGTVIVHAPKGTSLI